MFGFCPLLREFFKIFDDLRLEDFLCFKGEWSSIEHNVSVLERDSVSEPGHAGLPFDEESVLAYFDDYATDFYTAHLCSQSVKILEGFAFKVSEACS